MTELICWPLDNKEYTAEALGAAYAARSRGILHAADFTATANGDNTLTIGPGVGCIHPGTYWAAFPYLLANTQLTFTDADGTNPRWDAVALTYDKNTNTAGLEVRTGTASASPALPELRRDDDYDEIFLYRITRPRGATKISADEHCGPAAGQHLLRPDARYDGQRGHRRDECRVHGVFAADRDRA